MFYQGLDLICLRRTIQTVVPNKYVCLSDSKLSVCPSVCLSVCQTRAINTNRKSTTRFPM